MSEERKKGERVGFCLQLWNDLGSGLIWNELLRLYLSYSDSENNFEV